jgi:hypothetical protein
VVLDLGFFPIQNGLFEGEFFLSVLLMQISVHNCINWKLHILSLAIIQSLNILIF